MKKSLFLLITVFLFISITACSGKETAKTTSGETKEITLKIGAAAVPHAEILNSIKPGLKAQGVNLDVKVFTDYVQPNVQLFEKQLDANFFQHAPYLDQFKKDKNYNLEKVVGVHIEPFGAYSKKHKKTNEIPNGATVAIPNDPTNGGRALLLLEKQGLIRLKDKKNLKFKELEAAMLPRVLAQVDLALINTNYALEAKLIPTKDALFIENSHSPYVNILVARPDNKDSEAIKKLAKALNTPEVKKFIEEKYNGAVVPAF